MEPIYCCWGNTVEVPNDSDCSGVGGGKAGVGGPGAHVFRKRLFALCMKSDTSQVLDFGIKCSVAAWPQYTAIAAIGMKVKCKCPLP